MRLDNANATIAVQSSNIDLGDILRDYARKNILRVASKYFGRLTRALFISTGRADPTVVRLTCR